jgi:hypothetical protein
MSVAVISGSAGVVGSEAVAYFATQACRSWVSTMTCARRFSAKTLQPPVLGTV